MYKKVATFIITITLLTSPSPSYASDIASGLSEFIYGLLYMNIGTTSCKEIVERKGGKEGIIRQMTQLVNTSNSMIGEEKIDMDEITRYFEDLYEHCEDNPDQMFAQALAQVTRPLFTAKNKHSDYMRNSFNNQRVTSQNPWSSMETESSGESSSSQNSQNKPQIIG